MREPCATHHGPTQPPCSQGAGLRHFRARVVCELLEQRQRLWLCDGADGFATLCPSIGVRQLWSHAQPCRQAVRTSWRTMASSSTSRSTDSSTGRARGSRIWPKQYASSWRSSEPSDLSLRPVNHNPRTHARNSVRTARNSAMQRRSQSFQRSRHAAGTQRWALKPRRQPP